MIFKIYTQWNRFAYFHFSFRLAEPTTPSVVVVVVILRVVTIEPILMGFETGLKQGWWLLVKQKRMIKIKHH
jgi:hypothetical protein